MARRTTKPRASEPATPITGVASGGLGTAANLDDTQLWDLEELRSVALEPEREAEQTPRRMPAGTAASVVRPVVPWLPRTAGGQRRTGLVAAAVVGVLALAALLAARDGLPSGATRDAGDAAGSFPTLPANATAAPVVTAAPAAGGGGGGGGNGRGNNGGNGNGNGNGGGSGR